MKKISTLFFLFLTLAAFSQSNDIPQGLMNTPLPAFQVGKFERSTKYSGHSGAIQNGNSRAANIGFTLDYGLLDYAYNQNVLSDAGFWYRDDQFSFRQVNSRLAVDSTAFQKWAITWFPKIIDQDNNTNWPFNEYAPNRIQMSIDTIYITMGHLHLSNQNDTLVISVWDIDAFTSINFDTGATGLLYGRMTLVTDTSFLGGTGQGTSVGSFLLADHFPFVPETPIVIPQGKRFLIQLDYYGPGGDAFLLSSTRRNDCASQCGASIPYVNATFNANIANWNSLYGVRYVDAVQNIKGVYPSTLFFNDCNTNGAKDSICEELYTANFAIYPHISATIPNFYVDGTSNLATACPGSSVSLLANGGGSNATPYTYEWTATSGTLSSASDQQVNLTLGNGVVNDTVIITLTDANQVSTKDTIIIKTGGIKVNITNPSPVVLPCSGSATIATNISGSTLGKFYTWSTGDQGAAKSTVNVNTAQNVAVTVTNSVGCSATASVAVTYSGVNNVVNFNAPLANGVNQWAGCPMLFKNTSTSYGQPWVATFDPTGNGSDLITITDGSQNIIYTYASPGVYPVKLTMDSAGCSFSKVQNVTITTKPSNQQCSALSIGIEDVEFSNGITMMPNPTNGKVSIVVNSSYSRNMVARVYNIIGEEVKSFTLENVTNTVDLSALANGAYMIKIESGDRIAMKKLVISK